MCIHNVVDVGREEEDDVDHSTAAIPHTSDLEPLLLINTFKTLLLYLMVKVHILYLENV